MKTKREAVSGTVHIYARPRSKHEINQSDDNLPFELELDSSSHRWNDSIKIDSQEVILMSPDGIDLVAAALATLKERKVKKKEEFEADIAEIETRERELLQLQYQPDASVVA
jgi:hypothetical protein